jgi:hypothetical protein
MAAKTKATRKPEMKAYPLAKDDVDALVAYVGALKKSTPPKRANGSVPHRPQPRQLRSIIM